MDTYDIYAIDAPKRQPTKYEIKEDTMFKAVEAFYNQFGITALEASDQYPKIVKIIKK